MKPNKLKTAANLFPELLSVKDRLNFEAIQKQLKSNIASKGSKILVPKEEKIIQYGDDFDIKALMDSAEDPVTGTLRNLKIDDRDLPYAKNFYDFTVNIVGNASGTPWARQMFVGLMLTADVCVACTKPKYLDINNIPKDAAVSDVKKALVLLEYGICRKCKRTKYDLLKNFNLKNYQQGVLIFGQRCVTADTLILTQDGLEYIGDLAADKSKGFSRFDKHVYNGTELEQTSDFYVAHKKEYVHKVTLSDGGVIKGTSDHPLLTLNGFKRIEELTEDDYVALSVGSNVWGTAIPVINSFPECVNSIPSEILKAPKKYVCDFLRSIYEKNGSIKNYDLIYTTESKKLVHEMRAILLNLNIISFISEKSSVYTLTITRIFDLLEFRDNIGFITKSKKKLLIEALNYNNTFIDPALMRIDYNEVWMKVKNIKRNYVIAQTYDLTLPKTHQFVANGIINHNSGKSSLSAFIAAYMTHCYLKFPDLASLARREMQASTQLTGTFVSLTFSKAVGVLWTPYKKIIEQSQWFKDYHLMLDFYGEKYSNRLYTDSTLYLEYKYKNFRFYPSGPKSSTLRGDCLTGDTMINTKLGFVHFDELNFVNGLHKTSNMVDTPFGTRKVSHTYKKNSREIIEIITSNGYSLKGTPEHPVLVLTINSAYKWVRLDKLAVGDWVVSKTDKNKPLFGTSTIGIKEAQMLGALTAKALTSNKKQIPFLVRTAPFEVIHAYLESYFANSTSVIAESQIDIYVMGESEFLIKQLHIILLQVYGIVSKLNLKCQVLTLEKNNAFNYTLCFEKLNIKSVLPNFKSNFNNVPYLNADSNAHYEQIAKIKVSKKLQTVYDITVPDGHAFTANGLSSHNTRIYGIVDELALFPLPSGDAEEDEQSERANADEAHKSLSRSLTTVQNVRNRLLREGYSSAPPSLMLSVSSPISMRDKMMRLLKQSKTEEGNKYIFAVQMPTWEINPSMEKSDPVISLAYSENYEKADRDYGANPPSVQSPFMRSPDLQDVFINGQNSHIFKYNYDRPGELYGTLEKIRNVKWPSLVTIDAGAVNNSFCIIVGHYDFDNQKTVVSTIIECMPHENRRINFNLLYEHVIKVLAKDLNAIAMLADQWQSIDLLHRIKDDMGNNVLQKPKVLSKQHSPNRRDFDVLLSMCRNKNLIFPSMTDLDKEKVDSGNVDNFRSDMLNKPVAHLYLQLLTIRDVGENKCPMKGDGMTDDIVRALVLFASKLHTPIIMERLKEAIPWVNSDNKLVHKPMPMPGFRSRLR